MSKLIIMLIYYTIAMLQIKLLIVSTKRPALVGIELATNVLVLNQKPILLIPLKPTSTTTIALIVARYLPLMLTAIQRISVAVLMYALLADNNLNSVQRLYSRTSKNAYYLNRQTYTQSYRLLFYLSILVALRKSTNLAIVISTTENTSYISLSIRIVGSQATPASDTLSSILKCVCRLRTRRGFLSNLTLNIKELRQKIYGPYLIRQRITQKLVDSLTRLYDLYYRYVVPLPTILV